MIKNIEETLLKFIETIVQFNGEMEEKEIFSLKIKEIQKHSKKLLINKIDRYALLFESENPEFYNEYHRLRKDPFLINEPNEKELDINNLVSDPNLEEMTGAQTCK